MPTEIIKELEELGEQAGRKLSEEFQFSHHRWVRLKVMMGLLEEQLQKISKVLDEQKLDYRAFLQEQKTDAFPYSEVDANWINNAQTQLQSLENLIRQWQQLKQQNPQFGFEQKPPLNNPDKPVLRVTPEL